MIEFGAIFIVIAYIIISIIIGIYSAVYKKKSAPFYFLISFFLSPILAIIFLNIKKK